MQESILINPKSRYEFRETRIPNGFKKRQIKLPRGKVKIFDITINDNFEIIEEDFVKKVFETLFSISFAIPQYSLPKPDPVTEAFEGEKQAFMNMKESLVQDEEYIGKFVAIYQGKIVGVSEDRSELAGKVYEEHGYVPLFIDKIEEKKRVKEIPSPERFV